MGSCHLNHSTKDVVEKLEIQKNYLPEKLVEELFKCLNGKLSQPILNDLFHLLKKYDLATTEEQKNRNLQLMDIMKKN